MTQGYSLRHPPDESEAFPLWELAAALGTDPEAVRQRRERKRQRLLEAGFLLAPDDPPEAWIRDDTTISGPPSSYPKGISPTTGDLHEGA